MRLCLLALSSCNSSSIVEMKISTFGSETIIFSRKRVECPRQVTLWRSSNILASCSWVKDGTEPNWNHLIRWTKSLIALYFCSFVHLCVILHAASWFMEGHQQTDPIFFSSSLSEGSPPLFLSGHVQQHCGLTGDLYCDMDTYSVLFCFVFFGIFLQHGGNYIWLQNSMGTVWAKKVFPWHLRCVGTFVATGLLQKVTWVLRAFILFDCVAILFRERFLRYLEPSAVAQD